MKIDKFSEGFFQKKEHKFCREIKDLLHDYCLKDLEYNYKDVKFYKNSGNVLVWIYIDEIINSGWLNTPGHQFTKESYKPFKKLIDFFEQEDLEFFIDCFNNKMRICILFENIEKSIENLGSMINANKYNL